MNRSEKRRKVRVAWKQTCREAGLKRNSRDNSLSQMVKLAEKRGTFAGA